MPPRMRLLALALAAVSTASGCLMFDTMKDATGRTMSRFRPQSEPQPTGSEWDFVGTEGRGDRPREQDPDPWWRHLMHPTSVSIEKNLGIDY